MEFWEKAMDGLEMNTLFSNIYKNKTVLITGHTGFKGSWISLWLKKLGAKVVGYSLPAPTDPSHFELLNLDIVSILGDIRDKKKLVQTFADYKPDIVFHLAAQTLVRYSYKNPIETFETNVMGTINILEACRYTPSVKAIVIVTSDKCYENKEWIWGYRENDPMGGHDPYSTSKGCAELATGSYRSSFFNPDEYKKSHNTLIASCRAGNVLGGGDWAEDRIIPDVMRAVSKNEKVIIRNPHAIRPWQHVLESLSGYLAVGQKLLEGKKEVAEAWNFGPANEDYIEVEKVVNHIKSHWHKVQYEIQINPTNFHEANILKLDCSKAYTKLKWKPVWHSSKTLEMTTLWYKMFYEKNTLLSSSDLDTFVNDARKKNIDWCKS